MNQLLNSFNISNNAGISFPQLMGEYTEFVKLLNLFKFTQFTKNSQDSHFEIMRKTIIFALHQIKRLETKIKSVKLLKILS